MPGDAAAPAVRDETVEVWDSRLRLHVKVAGNGPPCTIAWPTCTPVGQPPNSTRPASRSSTGSSRRTSG